MEKVSGRYTIQSKSNPDNVLFIGTSSDIGESIKWHIFHLAHRMHPVPELQNHLMKYGLSDFNFVADPVKPKEIIEKAIIQPIKETRNKRGRPK